MLSTYLLQTWAELLLSPTGLSASSKLAPEGASGQMLALWFLAVSVGTSIGGQIGKFTADPSFEESLYRLLAAEGLEAVVEGSRLYER